MKINEIRLAKGALTDNIYAGKVAKNGKCWTSKTDVTNDFIAAAIARWNGFEETITAGNGKKYKVRITELKP